jgi:DNA polymerase-1
MLLQVHDELVFEAKAEDADAVCKLVARVMEKAAEPAHALSVPLVVEARAAANWDEAH